MRYEQMHLSDAVTHRIGASTESVPPLSSLSWTSNGAHSNKWPQTRDWLDTRHRISNSAQELVQRIERAEAVGAAIGCTSFRTRSSDATSEKERVD